MTLALLSGVAWAVDLGVIEVAGVTPVVYETPEPLTVQVVAMSVRALAPLPVGDHEILLPELRYRVEGPSVWDPPAGFPRVPLLHAPELSLAWIPRPAGPWSSRVAVGGGLGGDLAVVDARVVRCSASVSAARDLGEEVELGLGIAANYLFGRLAPVPLLHLVVDPAGAFKLDVLLPVRAELSTHWHDRARFGLLAELFGNQFAIRDADFLAAICPDDSATCVDHVAYTDGNVVAVSGVRLGGGLWLELHAGASLYRRFDLLTADRTPAVPGASSALPAAGLARVHLRVERSPSSDER